MTPTRLPIALRVFAVPEPKPGSKPRRRHGQLAATAFPWPPVLVFDCETSTDPTQRLLFGAYRFCRWAVDGTLDCLEEGLLYGDDLPRRDPAGFALLQTYAREEAAAVVPDVSTTLRFYSRTQFVEQLLSAALDAEALLVGFNVPFDISRIALRVAGARHPPFYGGFSFELGQWIDREGRARAHPFRPRALCKTIDSKRALMGLSGIKGAGPKTLFPGWPFLDLHTLTFALTDQNLSLRAAGELFRARYLKDDVEGHGIITPEYITYCRHDVRATAALLERLREEFDRHPIPLAPTVAFSPASLGKGYLAAMGITPPAQQFADIPPEVLGQTMLGYFGGRADARIRRTAVPVAYCDFLSMYPTVNALMGMWDLLTAERIEIVEATAEVQALLDHLTVDQVFDRTFWPELRFFALVEPKDDTVPLRAQYDPATADFGIGINRVTAPEGLWYAGPDVVASALLTGRAPHIRRAFRLVPHGRQGGLRPVQLRGEVTVDPTREDFFRRLIEARAQVCNAPTRAPDEREALQKWLKVLANSSGYGIFAELNPQDLPEGQRPQVTVYGPDQPFTTKPTAPERLGEYCFPPFAALTTAAARLMLALLERVVTEAGGSYAFCDTDSMAIVASPRGGLVSCEGGPDQLSDGTPAIHALAFAEVDALVARFAALNPYDPSVIPGSILRQEYVCRDANDVRVPLYAWVISAKRYALFTRDPHGAIHFEKVSEHGLGHLMDPLRAPRICLWDRKVPAWIVACWEWLLARELGRPMPAPAWFDQPALSQVTVSTARLAIAVNGLNANKSYADTIKPMGFLLSAQVVPFGHPVGSDPAAFHLVAPFEKKPEAWATLPWIDKYTGQPVLVTTDANAPPEWAIVKTIRNVVEAYAVHPEPKSADANGIPCGRATRGLLQRRSVTVGTISLIGKEANRIEEVEAGLIHEVNEVRTTYGVVDTWDRDIVPLLKRLPAARLAKWGRCSVRTIKNLRNGHTQPSPGIRRRMERAMAQWTEGPHAASPANQAATATPGTAAAPEALVAPHRLSYSSTTVE